MAQSAVLERPDTEIGIFWNHYRTLRRQRLRINALGVAVFLIAFAAAAVIGDLDPVKIWNGLPRLNEFIVKILPLLRWDSLQADLAEWLLPFRIWMKLLAETLLIAFVASVIGTMGAAVFCFPASRNLVSSFPLYFAARRAMEIFRTVPELVYALIFVFCFGVGPIAGVLAIAVHSTGALGKLFSEVNENVDPRPIEGVRAAGGNWFQIIRYAVVPQVLPNFTSYALLRFEINVRSSSIIGFVGAGGLGQEIRTALGLGYYTDLSAIFLIILLTVAAIDITCERIRHRFIAAGGAL